MKAHYKLFLPIAIGLFFTFVSCKDDEVLNLTEYPVNQPTITIDNTEGASEKILTAVYKEDGSLELNGPVSRTYTFHFAASPKDATVTFEILNTNIPKENVEISTTKTILPAGSTDATVTVNLKNEDFSFAQADYDSVNYVLGVKASVEGYKIGSKPIESKVVIKKEKYIAACSIVGKNGNKVSFERAYSQGNILDSEPISYTFKMKLDKPARQDVKIKLATTGLDEKFMNDITVTPAEITIPAGKLESEEITWSITNGFLLTTADAETHTLIVTASAESEDPVVSINKKENVLTFNINKVIRNFEYISNKVDDWSELSKSSWSVELGPDVWGSGSTIIDGEGGKKATDIYFKGEVWFIIDMKEAKQVSGFGIDYYENDEAASCPKKVTISTSSDNITWVKQGTADTPRSYNHYFRFFTPLTTRYIKVELSSERYDYYNDVTEIYVYNAQ
ncbi:DUF4989 domain-containing protein [Coprobacter tertius]|uniref:DUF4989 domain-containing protein n=1 Tax=Coprobacter tertius TaxID=2944915 RepID=A0ABT1MHY0_9BACT|nr:DUF4989 domain-containing protein [Coprobacter tertius]MCP9612240.1 DUF4989 domain-containing protein [Coprobacter tertius]